MTDTGDNSPADKSCPPSDAKGNVPESPNLAQKAIAASQQAKRDKALKQASSKTFLDLDACRDVVGKMFTEKEEKVKEQLAQAVPEAPKPQKHIDQFKKATPCSSYWEKLTGTDKIRFCSLCQLEVYDFTDMEMQEAQDTVWHKEGRRNVPLFKRKDGKFLTSDCPVGLSKRNQFILATVGGGIAVAILLYVLMTMPPPPKPAAETKPTVAKKAPVSRTTSAKSRIRLPAQPKSVQITGGANTSQPAAPSTTQPEPAATPETNSQEAEPALPAGLHYANH